ncbi:MAG TPA: cytochrome c-type biogenesis protein CcmH [Chloroflexota bacterium]|nr:cytochrome c-type biogenesis protein CcmH [Chloroflexota bacterium]
MRWFGVGIVLLALLLFPAAAFAQSYTSTSASQSLDDQTLAIANQLQCPVCENVTVAYSNSTLAGQMRQVIREKLQQGETRDQIIQYFVDRYGEGILTQPPKHGLNLLVWLLPVAGILAGLGIVGSVLWARRPASASTPNEEPPLSPEDERLLARALEGAE